MSFHGRSADDLPLAAYTTGVVPDGADEAEEVTPDPGYTSVPAASSSTADRLAQAHAAEAVAAAAPAKASRASMPSLKLPSFKLPSLRRAKPPLEDGAPFQPVTSSAKQAAAFQAVRPDMAPPAPSPRAAAPATPVVASAASAATATLGVPGKRSIAPPASVMRPRGLALDPRGMVRDPRILAGGVVVIGLALLGISLLGGGGPTSGATGANGSQDPAALHPTPPPGNASVELTGGGTGTYTLTSASGSGPAVASQVNATWTDAAGSILAITGAASNGPRTTDANFVLSWTMLVNGAPVTFTSKAKECTVGMAVGPTAVKGGFVCKKLASPDGKHVIDLSGTYTT